MLQRLQSGRRFIWLAQHLTSDAGRQATRLRPRLRLAARTTFRRIGCEGPAGAGGAVATSQPGSEFRRAAGRVDRRGSWADCHPEDIADRYHLQTSSVRSNKPRRMRIDGGPGWRNLGRRSDRRAGLQAGATEGGAADGSKWAVRSARACRLDRRPGPGIDRSRRALPNPSPFPIPKADNWPTTPDHHITRIDCDPLHSTPTA